MTVIKPASKVQADSIVFCGDVDFTVWPYSVLSQPKLDRFRVFYCAAVWLAAHSLTWLSAGEPWDGALAPSGGHLMYCLIKCVVLLCAEISFLPVL